MRRCCANCGWLSVNPSGAMFCGYSDERTWEDESCMAWKDNEKLRTKADSIRSMTDEELAEWFGKIQYDAAYYWAGEDKQKYPYPDGWLDWLKQEAEGASDG